MVKSLTWSIFLILVIPRKEWGKRAAIMITWSIWDLNVYWAWSDLFCSRTDRRNELRNITRISHWFGMFVRWREISWANRRAFKIFMVTLTCVIVLGLFKGVQLCSLEVWWEHKWILGLFADDSSNSTSPAKCLYSRSREKFSDLHDQLCCSRTFNTSGLITWASFGAI